MSERAGKVEPQGHGKPPPLLPKPTLNVRATLDAARSTSEGLREAVQRAVDEWRTSSLYDPDPVGLRAAIEDLVAALRSEDEG